MTVSLLVRLVPGLVAAGAALLAMELVSLVGFISVSGRTFVFFAAYLAIAIVVDRAMAAYGDSGR